MNIQPCFGWMSGRPSINPVYTEMQAGFLEQKR